MACNIEADRDFGPGLRCQQQFDFTLTFEQAVFGIGVPSLFLLYYVVRVTLLYGAETKTLRSLLHPAKILLSVAILAVQIYCLILWTQYSTTQISIAAAALGCVAALALVTLAIFEHSRSVRPSSFVLLYLLASIATDAVQLRTLLLRKRVPAITRLIAGGLGIKSLLLLVESWPKRSYLKPVKNEYGPEEVSGVFSRSVFWWLNSLLILGYRKILTLDNLFPLDHELYSQNVQERMQKSWKKNESRSSYSLIFTVLSGFRWRFLTTIIPRAAMIGFSYAQTFLIHATIKYLERPQGERNTNHAYGLIGAAATIYFGIALSTANFNHKMYRIVTAYRGGTSSLIYSRIFTKKSGYNGKAAITLMSTDVDRTTISLTKATEAWAQILEVAIGIWLLWRQLGPISIAPIIITALCFWLQLWMSKFMGPKQALWVKAIQRRVTVASTSLGSMKSIKLSGLVDSMSQLFQAERVRELRLARDFRWMTLAVNVVSQIPLLFSALVVFAAYAIQAKVQHKPPLSTSQAFTSFAIMSLLTTPAGTLLNSISIIRSALGLTGRIQDFLLKDSLSDGRLVPNLEGDVEVFTEKIKPSVSYHSEEAMLSVSDLIIGPPDSGPAELKPESRAISFTAGKGALTIAVGPVGCGKSTLLKAVLGEVNPVSGTITISTSFIGYCSQTPWLPNCKIRDAIIGPGELNREWYDKVVHVCALESDFARMPQKDLTPMGTRGVMLSGGQKHRIALARALYSRSSVLVLDDFLSNLDHETRNSIVHRLFSKNGHMKQHGCTVLLATHEDNFFHLAENLVVFKAGGTLEFCGPPFEWPNLDKEALLPDDFGAQDSAASSPTITMASKSEEQDSIPKKKAPAKTEDKNAAARRQGGDWHDWVYYGNSIGAWPMIVALFFTAISIFAINFPKLWLQWSTGSTYKPLGLFIGIFALSSFCSLLGFVAMIYQFLIVIGPVSAVRLHQILVKATFSAPMSFFESTDASVMLNRFSQDMSLIDLQLPMAAWNVLMSSMMCIMNAILICLGSSYLAAAIPVFLIALYWIQKFYLRTSRQMRLLDLESKSPLYQHFTETIEGQETIRAFGWQEYFNHGALMRLDVSQKPYYLLYCIQRWLNLVLDCVVGSLAVLLVALALSIPQSSSGGALGVALTSVLMFNTSLKQTITNWTQAETSLGSISRTSAFEKDTPNENSLDDNFDPGADWPSKGDVDVSRVGVIYGDGTTALHEVSFRIGAGQKFAICGRTGSGKSTMLSSLLRLLDPSQGTILIDGVNIAKVPRNIVRGRLICLPQDALVFAGTFRYNLDPQSHISSDDEIIKVLHKVGLWFLVEKRGGLVADLAPNSLSHGEQQLLALGRAILRKQVARGKCILVLDEATSNLDTATEALIQKVIDEEFSENTVITVAHRLSTVRNVDAVALLEKGEIDKIGPPAEVLEGLSQHI